MIDQYLEALDLELHDVGIPVRLRREDPRRVRGPSALGRGRPRALRNAGRGRERLRRRPGSPHVPPRRGRSVRRARRGGSRLCPLVRGRLVRRASAARHVASAGPAGVRGRDRRAPGLVRRGLARASARPAPAGARPAERGADGDQQANRHRARLRPRHDDRAGSARLGAEERERRLVGGPHAGRCGSRHAAPGARRPAGGRRRAPPAPGRRRIRRPVRRPRFRAHGLVALRSPGRLRSRLVVFLAAAVQGDPFDGAVSGTAEALACLAGFAAFSRYLGLRR